MSGPDLLASAEPSPGRSADQHQRVGLLRDVGAALPTRIFRESVLGGGHNPGRELSLVVVDPHVPGLEWK
eukprot:13584395-Heterocapsa_arctica.AAC.1